MDIEKLASFDSTEFIRNNEEASIFLQDAMESNNPAVIAVAMGIIVRACDMVKLAKASGVSRPLYAAFSETGNPTLSTILAGILPHLVPGLCFLFNVGLRNS